ncbi:MAG: hypothetical protein L0177_04295 [Chloroflexi bacterium]|nr:hypothetical protein [Chloroflexota bacterium]
MGQIIYALQFKGTGGPVSESSPNLIKAATSSPSSRIASSVGAKGLESKIEEIRGGRAQFESQVTLTGETSLDERGSVAFGEGNVLHFTTVGEGYIGPSPEEGVSQGAVIWRVEGGQGQFEGATGFITSNFTFSSKGEVVDNQFGVINVQ